MPAPYTYIAPASKPCKECGHTKLIEDYYFSGKKHRPVCIECSITRSKLSGKKKYAWAKKDSCEECGFKADHPCQLDVDHTDGDHNNNDISNLKTLCANCHRLKTLRAGNHRKRSYRPKEAA